MRDVQFQPIYLLNDHIYFGEITQKNQKYKKFKLKFDIVVYPNKSYYLNFEFRLVNSYILGN